MQNLTIRGREYTAEGPLPTGHYVLQGPRGSAWLAVPFEKEPHFFVVIGGRWCNRDLYIDGNRIFLTDADGELREDR